MSRIPLDILRGYVGPDALDCASEEFRYFTSGEIKALAAYCPVEIEVVHG
jgi:hypothetical protein